MAKIKLADYVINFYSDIGVDKIFIVYGAANGDLIDAFSRNKKTEYVAVLHEQAGGFAAEGYVFAGFVFWIICYAMSRYSISLERKYKTDR